MLKAFVKDTVILGLSEENINLLKEGKPIRLNLSELGLSPQKIFIVYGETETKIKNELMGLAGIDNPFTENKN